MKHPREPKPTDFEALSYREQLLWWGHSDGNFRPNFVLTNESVAALRQLQADIVQVVPGAEPVEELHCTAFFCPPQKLYTFLQDNDLLYSGCTEADFYDDLATTIAVSTMPIGLGDIQGDDSVAGFEIVDGKTPILALRVGETSTAAITRERMRELLIYNLRYNVRPEGFDILREDPRFKWMLLESIPHISLANVPPDFTDIPNLPIPTELSFNGMNIGTIEHPVNDPQDPDALRKWYLGLSACSFDF